MTSVITSFGVNIECTGQDSTRWVVIHSSTSTISSLHRWSELFTRFLESIIFSWSLLIVEYQLPINWDLSEGQAVRIKRLAQGHYLFNNAFTIFIMNYILKMYILISLNYRHDFPVRNLFLCFRWITIALYVWFQMWQCFTQQGPVIMSLTWIPSHQEGHAYWNFICKRLIVLGLYCPYFDNKKQEINHPNLRYWCFYIWLSNFTSRPNFELRHNVYPAETSSRHHDIASMLMYMTDTFCSVTRKSLSWLTSII